MALPLKAQETRVSRYFIHMYDGGDGSFDTVGVECLDIRELRLHLLSVAMKEVTAAQPQKPVWSLEALDEHGTIVASIDLGLLSSTDYRL